MCLSINIKVADSLSKERTCHAQVWDAFLPKTDLNHRRPEFRKGTRLPTKD